MTHPDLSVSLAPVLDSTADVIILAARSTDDGALLTADPAFDALAGQLSSLGVTGGRDELVRIPASLGTAGSIAIIGLGSDVTSDALRHAAGSAIRQLAGAGSVAFALPLASVAEVEAVLEGAALGAYAYTEFRQASLKGRKQPVQSVIVHTALDVGDAISRVGVVADAVTLVKDLVNMPPSHLYPASLADRAAEEASGLPVDVRIWDEEGLAADGFGGILGVGQGSTRPPRLVKVTYSPAGATKHLALVGKGITFDSGGLSLKPPASMVGMKDDMTGAATVLAVTLAAARLGLPVRLTAWLCIAENMPSGSAIRPNDVLRIRGGRTVEVLNTDAEGRLVMADGLVAASEEEPDAIVDVATLTGAAVVALGKRYFGVLGDDEFVQRVVAASTSADELAWPMPMPGELRALLKSDVADIANAKIGNTAGGMLLAAVFLKEFIGKRGTGEDSATIPWAHLDIAGPAWNADGQWGFTGSGATGVAVRALIRLAEDFSRP